MLFSSIVVRYPTGKVWPICLRIGAARNTRSIGGVSERLDHITPNRNEWQFTQWEELLWYRDDIAGEDYTQTLPLGYYAPGAGWMTSRSSWATDAVQVAMICGPSRESHQDRAQNGFTIFSGAWLAALARLNSHDGLFEDAQYNNSITVGGFDQSGNQQTARVVHFGDALAVPGIAIFDNFRLEGN